jgi:hypothetical protein
MLVTIYKTVDLRCHMAREHNYNIRIFYCLSRTVDKVSVMFTENCVLQGGNELYVEE